MPASNETTMRQAARFLRRFDAAAMDCILTPG